MSGSLREYLFRIIAAAVLCAIIKSFADKSSVSGTILKTLCGVFLTLAVLSPLMNINFSSVYSYVDAFSLDTTEAVQAGSQMSESTLRSSIKQQTEAYILDKAALIQAELSVEVKLSDDNPPVPFSVVLEGQVSPYAKSKLSKLISDNLGIAKENQIWI